MEVSHELLNLFIKTRYSIAEEDRVLNGLLICLQQIPRVSISQFFIRMSIPLDQKGELHIRDHIPVSPDSIVDAEIKVIDKTLIWIEAKVIEHQFEESEQIRRYSKLLLARKEPKKYLLLLSPDRESPPVVHSNTVRNGVISISWRSWKEISTTLTSLSEMSSSTNQVAHFLISHYVTYLKELGLITSDKDEEGLKNELSAKLRFLLANVASEKILLHLYHHGRGHLREIVRDHAIGIGGVQKALARLTKGQIIVKRKEGNLVVYSYNDRNPLVSPILELVRITYNSIPQDLRTKIFSPKYTKKE